MWTYSVSPSTTCLRYPSPSIHQGAVYGSFLWDVVNEVNLQWKGFIGREHRGAQNLGIPADGFKLMSSWWL